MLGWGGVNYDGISCGAGLPYWGGISYDVASRVGVQQCSGGIGIPVVINGLRDGAG